MSGGVRFQGPHVQDTTGEACFSVEEVILLKTIVDFFSFSSSFYLLVKIISDQCMTSKDVASFS